MSRASRARIGACGSRAGQDGREPGLGRDGLPGKRPGHAGGRHTGGARLDRAGRCSVAGPDSRQLAACRGHRRAARSEHAIPDATVKEDTRKEVRAKEAQIHTLKLEAEQIQGEIKVIEQNLQLLTKLEDFTGATLKQLSDKGQLNSEATLTLARYVMTTRGERATAMVGLQQKLQENTAATEFANRELAELTAGSSRIERDAVVVVDNPGPAGKIRLNYLVTAATWRPQYRFRAGGEKDPIQLQYLAAIEQQSGEDWTGVDMTLSTAQPQLNATPPDLLALDITVVGRGMAGAGPGQPGQQQQAPNAAMMGGGMALMNSAKSQIFRDQSQELRKKAQNEMIGNRVASGKNLMNEAAALEQAEELLARKDDTSKSEEKASTTGEVAAITCAKVPASPITCEHGSQFRRAATSSSSTSRASRRSRTTITRRSRC